MRLKGSSAPASGNGAVLTGHALTPGTVFVVFETWIVVVLGIVEVTTIVIVRGGTLAIASNFALYAAASIGVSAERELLVESTVLVEPVNDCPDAPQHFVRSAKNIREKSAVKDPQKIPTAATIRNSDPL